MRPPFPTIAGRLLWHQSEGLRRCLLCTTAQPKEISVAVSVSSLRIDTVVAAGLDISRKNIWEACLEGLVMLNGHQITKKSNHVKEGDIIEVDTILKPKQPEKKATTDHDDQSEGTTVKRGRVVVKEIGAQTRKGGYHLTLLRYKQFALLKRTLSTLCATES